MPEHFECTTLAKKALYKHSSFLFLLLHFQAGDYTRRPNLALVFFVFILCCSISVFRMSVCFCCVRFSPFSTSQEIGWEECVRKDLFCVELDVKPKSNVSYGTGLAIYMILVRLPVASATTCREQYFEPCLSVCLSVCELDN